MEVVIRGTYGELSQAAEGSNRATSLQLEPKHFKFEPFPVTSSFSQQDPPFRKPTTL